MKKKILVFTLFFMLIIPSFPLVSLPEEAEGVLDSFSPSSSNGQGGIGSSEEENIDSFDVHPLNRWVIQTDDSDIDSVVVKDGYLNITDAGDGSSDSYQILRDLRDLDGKIEIRFKIESNSSSGAWNDLFGIYLDDNVVGSDDSYRMGCGSIESGSSVTTLSYDDILGDAKTKNIVDDCVTGEWYVFRIQYNILKSSIRGRLYFDNNTKVWDWNWQDISSETPGIFDENVLTLRLLYTCTSDTVLQTVLIDYINAPFKEREWEVKTESVDAQWLENSWNFAYGSGDVETEICNYSLIVPYLDLVSGELRASSTTGAIPTNNWMYTDFLMYGVDADDGEIHELIGATVGIFDIGSGDFVTCYIGSGVGWTTPLYQKSIAYTGVEKPLVRFAMASIEDRDAIQFKIRFFPDEKVSTVFYDFVREVDSSSYSSEFLLETKYWINIDAGEDATLSVTNLDILERDIWDGIGNFIDSVIGGAQDVVGGGVDIFSVLFRWLGGMLSAAFTLVGESLGVIFVAVGAVIVAALSPIATSLSTLAADIWSGIGNALDFLETAIGLVTTAVGNVASDVATAVWTGISSTLDFITDAISDIAAAIWVAVLAVASDLADLVVDIIDFLIGLAGNIVSAIWDFITTAIFFLWDALGLPDLLAIVDLFLVAFVEIITNIPAFIQQVIPRLLALWGLFAVIGIFVFLILPALASENIGEFFEKFIHYFFTDITMGASFFGIAVPIPAGLLWLVTVIYYILGSTIYGGFFT